MALGCEMDDAVNFIFPNDAPHLVEVGYVGFYECVIRLILDVLEIGKIPGIRKLVEVDDMVVGILVYEKAYNV